MVKREINDKEGTIDCHYFAVATGILCMITQVIDNEFESDNLLFEGRGKTHKEARLNALKN